jgi:uncharacterized protein (UPF0548 family)
VFLLTRPSAQTIQAFLRASRETSLSYSPAGIVQFPPAGCDVDDAVVTIGRGEPAFTRARTALTEWKHFDLGWVELNPSAPPVEPGAVVAVLIRHLGFWSLNGCRVVATVGARDRGTRFGFTYGTLLNHAEQGEELFEVAFDEVTGDVTYRIRAVSRPRATVARLGYPIVRRLQARFRRDSGAAMRRAANRERFP